MGNPRLLEVARPVGDPRAADIRALVADMFDTMHAANGAGLAAPQIGVGLRVVIFGYRDAGARNPRYPDADPVPETILINPELTPLGDELEEGWEGCLSVPGLRGVVPRHARLRYRGLDLDGTLIERENGSSTHGWCNTSAITWTASSIRCASPTSRDSVIPMCCFRAWSTPTIESTLAPLPVPTHRASMRRACRTIARFVTGFATLPAACRVHFLCNDA